MYSNTQWSKCESRFVGEQYAQRSNCHNCYLGSGSHGKPKEKKMREELLGKMGCICVLVYLCTLEMGMTIRREGVGKEWSFEGDGTIMIDLVPAASLFALYIFARPMICPRICGTCICFKCHPNNHWCKLVWKVWDISGPIGNLNCWPNKLEFNEKMVYIL